VTTDPVNGLSHPLQDVGSRQAPVLRESQPASVPAAGPSPADGSRGPGGDRVELSDAARALAEPGAAAGAGSQIDPERLRAVLTRQADGHYDGAEACDAIARKLVADLGG